MMAPTKMKLRVRKKEKSLVKSSQRQQPLRPETSPDSKCPICLDRFVNVASVERCLHRFCFRCIREWAKNKAVCPLCKQPFRSIFHSVRTENDFKEFVVEDNAQSATTSASATVTMSAAATAAAPAGQNDAEITATQTRRSRATRSSQRRSQRAQDPVPSASSMDGLALDHTTMMQRDPACLRQLLPWLRRERVMGANPSELRPFLLARTDHILHELVSFARSIEAMQCPPAPSYEEDSGSQSSIINISEDDDDSEEAEVTEDNTQDRVPTVPLATSSEISLSQSAWDDETPGPSYSTVSHAQTEEVEPDENQLVGTSAATEQSECNDDDNEEEEECMIVGYVKPMAERTPELVQLSSDSSEEEEGDKAAATETVMKTELSLPSQEQAPISPKPYPSTSHTERGENLEHSHQQNAGKHSHHRRKDHTPSRGFRKPSHSLSGSQSSSESSPQSGHSLKISRSHIRLSCQEPRKQGHQLLGRSPTVFNERDGSSSEELVPTRSIHSLDKSSKPFSPWDSPGYDSERKKKRRKRRRERETERSRSPHRESRHRYGDHELWLCSSNSSSSSSEAGSRQEKPAGKRKYKTRHLERTARRRSSRKSRERERSPSVEIIYERRASDTHSRGRRHKKRSRRKEREQSSPTVITIDSDSSSDHTADCQNRHTEASAHTNDYQKRLLDDDGDDVANDRTVDYQQRYIDDNERVTDFSDHTIDYQERLAEFSDRTTDDKDCITDGRSCTNDYKDHVSDQNCGTVLNEPTLEHKDGVAAVSSLTSNYTDKVMEVGDYTTDHKHGVQKVSEQATEHNAADVSHRGAAYKHSDNEVNSNCASCTDDSNKVIGYTTESKPCEAEVNDRTSDYQESLLDGEDSPDDQDSVTDIGTRGEEPNSSILDMLNLEHCLVDMVQPRSRVTDNSCRDTLSDMRLLELEDSLLGEGQGILRNGTMDQQEAGLVVHRDQSEAETEHADVTTDSHVSAEMSPDV